ncbi:MAG: transcriptional regulator NrdR [Phycisphaerales bacterium]
MVCPFCAANDDKVIDSRASEAGAVIRRRRECLKCGRRFTTYERVEELSRLVVVKRDGTRVTFDRQNILRGINAACGKRPVGHAARERVMIDVEEQLYRDYEREVPSRAIGEAVCAKLRDLDEIAYIRFASEYHRFEDLGEIAQEIRELEARVKDVKDQQRLFDDGPAGGGPRG